MKTSLILTLCFVIGSLLSTFTGNTLDDTEKSHVELGVVKWNRDFDKAKSIAKKANKPLFVLFQEIPGCQTCQDFGNSALSFPLVVEAIEDLFVPVAIFNNKEGTDADLLKKFKEPAWNNPVVRYLNPNEVDIIDRKDKVWTIDGTIERMITALKKAGKPVPGYLPLARKASNEKTEVAEFAMHCYWEGEAKLGSINGVHSTRSGWRNGLEVVQLQFSPSQVDYKTLLDAAQKFECASKVFTHNKNQFEIAKTAVQSKAEQASGPMRDAKASDQKYYLSHTIYKYLPLTELQATKINVLAKQRKQANSLLSPRQLQILTAVQKALSADKNALNGFVFPEDQNKLASYQKKLVEHLKDSGAL